MPKFKEREEDGIFFVGEREQYMGYGWTDERISQIYESRKALKGIIADCDSKGIKEFKMSYDDVAKAFPEGVIIT